MYNKSNLGIFYARKLKFGMPYLQIRAGVAPCVMPRGGARRKNV